MYADEATVLKPRLQRQSHILLLCIGSFALGAGLTSDYQSSQTDPIFADMELQVQRCYHADFGQAVGAKVTQSYYMQRDVRIQRIKMWLPKVPVLGLNDLIRVRGLCTWDPDYRQWNMRAGAVSDHQPRGNLSRGHLWQAIEQLPRHRGLASALLLGVAPHEEKRQFRLAGIAHVLVVSGLHVGIMFILVAWILRTCAVPWWPAQAIIVGVLCYYLWLTGAAVATQRAVLMAAIIILGNLLGRKLHRYTALSLTVILLLLYDPLMAHSLSFQLSVAAVVGILTLGLSLCDLRKRYIPLHPWPLDRPIWRFLLWISRGTLDAFCIGLAASIAITPLLANYISVNNPWSPLATIVVTPILIAVLASGGFYLACVSIWADGPWNGLIALCDYSLSALNWISLNLAKLPGSELSVHPIPWYGLLLWPLLFIPASNRVKSICFRLELYFFLLLLWYFCSEPV